MKSVTDSLSEEQISIKKSLTQLENKHSDDNSCVILNINEINMHTNDVTKQINDLKIELQSQQQNMTEYAILKFLATRIIYSKP